MEKVLRRTILNRNNIVKKERRKLEQELRVTWRDYNRTKNMQALQLNNIIKQERKARREDWILGPLAPKRDVGTRKETYGAVNNLLAQGAPLPKRESRWPKGDGYDAVGSEDKRIPGFEDGEWRGEGLIGNLVVGDRVVVVKGRLGVKGKIGEVTRIEQDSNQVFIKGINKVDMLVPPQAHPGSSGTKIFEQEMPVAISDLRLVYQLQDPQTNNPKDVIIRQVYGGPPYVQRDPGSNLPRHTRYIKTDTSASLSSTSTSTSFDAAPSSNLAIAWPKEDPDRGYTQTSDTTRHDVEQITYTPSLMEVAVMPEGVIDELRGKHSRTRREWDDTEWMKRKMLEDARRDWFVQRSQILSQPFWTKEFLMKEKKAREKEV